MRNCILLLLILCLTFTGCAAEPADPVHTFDDLSIQIPTGYINLSSEEFAADLNFVFGLDPIAVNGLREEKATFDAYGLNLIWKATAILSSWQTMYPQLWSKRMAFTPFPMNPANLHTSPPSGKRRMPSGRCRLTALQKTTQKQKRICGISSVP